MSSSSTSTNTNRRICGCGEPIGTWTAWTRKNPARRFISCRNYKDEDNNCGFFRWIGPKLPSNWYKAKMFELRAQANGEAALLDGPPDDPFDFQVHDAPHQVVYSASETVNVPQAAQEESGIWKFVMACLVCFVVGLIFG